MPLYVHVVLEHCLRLPLIDIWKTGDDSLSLQVFFDGIEQDQSSVTSFGQVRASQIKVTRRSTSGPIQVMVGTQSLNLVIRKSISGQFGVTQKSH